MHSFVLFVKANHKHIVWIWRDHCYIIKNGLCNIKQGRYYNFQYINVWYVKNIWYISNYMSSTYAKWLFFLYEWCMLRFCKLQLLFTMFACFKIIDQVCITIAKWYLHGVFYRECQFTIFMWESFQYITETALIR